MTPAPVLVVASEPAMQPRARELARALHASFSTSAPEDEGLLLLEVTTERLQLRPSGRRAAGPVFVDLAHGAVGRRRREMGLHKTPLARAVGATREGAITVLDATAGLGTDSALLAWMGCHVRAVERSPVLAALWRDALHRLRVEAPDVAGRLSFEEGEAREVLERLLASGEGPDVVYIDPMFPARTKSALVKKEMQVLHALHGEASEEEAGALLALARRVGRRRVVIKRPRGSPPLSPGVTHAHEGATTRLDVYVRPPTR